MQRIAFTISLLAVLVAASANAQWLNQPTVGLPRDAQGKVNLNAPVPKLPDGTPDLSGQWNQAIPVAYLANITTDLPPEAITPAAQQLFIDRLSEFGKDDPGTIGCLPLGPRQIIGGGTAANVKILQSPTLIAILFEDLTYRQIHLDGRKLPDDPNPSFMGYSVGRWEGDTLVVDSVGFNDRTWLDFGGDPHSDRLKMTERFRRVSFGRIEREVTLVDEAFYRAPIVFRGDMTLRTDTELLEYVCNENPRSRPHLVGRSADEKKVVVSPETLRRYAGTYNLVDAPRTALGTTQLTITLSDGRLFVDLNGKGHLPMTAMSRNTFSSRVTGTLEFIADATGNVTHLFSHAAEGTTRFNRAR